MIIFGFRQTVAQLTMATFLCGQCSNPTAHALRKAVNKFTLFFIPLFPIGVKYFTQCTFCGYTSRLTKEQADDVLAHNPGYPQPAQPQSHEQGPTGSRYPSQH